MRRRALALAVLLASAGAAAAEAPEDSPRPPARDAVPAPVLAAALRLAAIAGTGVEAWGRAEAAPRESVPIAAGDGAMGSGVALAAAGTAGLPVAGAERASTSGVLVSPRPPPRLDEAAAAPVPGAERPPRRPAALERRRNPASAVEVVQPASGLAVRRSPRPAARPENLARRAVVLAAAAIPSQPDPGAITGRRGALCGDRRIRGETIAPIAGRIRGCGVENPVRITEVAGVRLSTSATVDCVTAEALADWVDETVKPTVGRLGGGVAGLEVFASYACRTRNNQAGEKISEHGHGRAIDIGAIVLANGASIRVLDHWRDEQLGGLLHAMHRGACGTFGTVLGPDANRFHQNHFHFDTARYRAGAFCR
jgi:hypothetical protein